MTSAPAYPSARAWTSSGAFRVCRAEVTKLALQWRTWLAVSFCVLGPAVFTLVVRAQSSLPTDTLFGRWVHVSGFAYPLVILGFSGWWVIPALAAVVSGDMFASEDRFGTWHTILLRSVSRGQVFMGKALVAAGYTLLVIVLLGGSSLACGVLFGRDEPLVGLSGQAIPVPRALLLVAASWALALAPALAFSALGVLASVATRYAPAGVGIPVLVGLVTHLLALADIPAALRMLLPSTAFSAWRGLLTSQPFYGPLAWGLAVSATYLSLATAAAYWLLRNREFTGSRA